MSLTTKKPKKILNDPKDSVTEFIEGLLIQYPNHLCKLENHNVVLLRDTDTVPSISGVQLICGGGSGHEPSHAGFIGRGMLSAAVCGGIFASPSVSSILAAIRVVAKRGGAGVLLVVKNYTGDRLNFGMAAERANQEGIVTQMVIVSDDCALPRTKGITGARGVAGTVLVNKIAGAAAATGKSLPDVVQIAKLVTSRIGTLGIALNSVTIPGAEQINNRLENDSIIEIGLGIHGEAGMQQSPLLSANEMARTMIATIQNYGRTITKNDGSTEIVPLFTKGDDLCILVNNLGGTSNFEMSILTRSCVKLLESSEFGAKVRRVFVGAYMTSFDMQGVSLTILNLQDQPELIELLDASTDAPAWQKCDVWKTGIERTSAAVIPELNVEESSVAAIPLLPLAIDDFENKAKKLIMTATQELIEAESKLTEYDTIVGDGDCGITMKRGATEILQRVQNGTIVTSHPVPMFASMADAVSQSMGGTSGVLLELMFRKISSTLSHGCTKDIIDGNELYLAFKAGVDAVSLYGGASVGSRTMLDALVPASLALIETGSISQAAMKAHDGAKITASMPVASAGRSNYLSEDTLMGTPDPGAVAVAIVLESLATK